MSACFIFVFFAAFCASGANFCIRRNLDKGGSSVAYLVIYFALSLLVALTINPVFSSNAPLNWSMLFLGLGVGALMVVMMVLTTFSLDRGPSSLTFAFQNSGSVFPTLALAWVFGSLYGFIITPGLITGGACVVVGL